MGEAEARRRDLGHEPGLGRFLDGGEDRLLAQISGRLHDAEFELGADDGGDPQSLVGVTGQAGEPAPHHVTHSFGDPELVDGTTGGPGAFLSLDRTGLGEVAENLSNEERVSFRLFVDRPGQGEARFVERAAGGLFNEGGHPDVVETGQRQPVDPALAAKVGDDLDQRVVVRQLGVPVGAEDEDPSGGHPDDVTQEEERRLRRPLEVVEHQHDGFLGGRGGQPGGHGVEEAVPLHLGIGSQRRRQPWSPIGQLGDQAGQLPAVAAEPLLQAGSVVRELAQRLHERLVRHAEVLVAAAGQHRGSLVVHLPGQLGGQPGLPDAGLPGQEGDPGFTGPRLLPQLGEPVELAVPADEDLSNVGEEGRERHRGLGGGLPVDLDCRERTRKSLELETTDRREGFLACVGHPPDDLRGENLPAPGGAAQPGRLDHRGAEAVVTLEDDVTGTDPDANAECRAAGPVMAVNGLLNGHRRLHRIRRTGEGGHETVAEVLDHGSAAPADGAGHQGVMLAAQGFGRDLTQP